MENDKTKQLDVTETKEIKTDIVQTDNNITKTDIHSESSDNNTNESKTEVTAEGTTETKTEEKPKPKWNRWQNKHKIPGKHKLKHDSIFKGKQEGDDLADEHSSSHRTEGFEIDKSSNEWHTTYEFEEYIRLKNLKQDIYNIIIDKTDINLNINRRKPGRNDFNEYLVNMFLICSNY